MSSNEIGPHFEISFLGAILLVMFIGAAIGLVARPFLQIRHFGITGHIGLGLFGSFMAGFVLPSLHFDVSSTFGEGILTSAIGAALALAVAMLLLGRER